MAAEESGSKQRSHTNSVFKEGNETNTGGRAMSPTPRVTAGVSEHAVSAAVCVFVDDKRDEMTPQAALRSAPSNNRISCRFRTLLRISATRRVRAANDHREHGAVSVETAAAGRVRPGGGWSAPCSV